MSKGRRPTNWSRRRALGASAAAGAALCAPALAQARARVVVVGGGAGGATTARYVAKESDRLEVTLINPDPLYTSCFFSNLYLAGLRSLNSLTHDLSGLSERYGVRLRLGRALSVDRDQKLVRLEDGGLAPYDRLVLSPGVSFRLDWIEGYDAAAENSMPHAYTGGRQVYALRQRLTEMRPGGVVLIAPPQNPYRCPPGPYERASMIANLLRRINPTAKVLIVDAKDAFAKQELFQEAWRAAYGDMVEWLPAADTAGGLARVDTRALEAETGIGQRIKADVANVIPPQRAADLVREAGLTASDGWAPIDGRTMRSRIDPNIFILGDSCNASPMPKSGFSANSQAHVAARAVRADLEGERIFPAKFRNTCWSFLDHQNVVKIGAIYEARENDIARVAGFVSQTEDTPDIRLENTLEANAWYAAMTGDMYG